jgi:hypothetical protein
MNVAMEQTEEFQDGQLKAKYGDAFIRGNNGIGVFVSWHVNPSFEISILCVCVSCVLFAVMYISTQKRRVAAGAK